MKKKYRKVISLFNFMILSASRASSDALFAKSIKYFSVFSTDPANEFKSKGYCTLMRDRTPIKKISENRNCISDKHHEVFYLFTQ